MAKTPTTAPSWLALLRELPRPIAKKKGVATMERHGAPCGGTIVAHLQGIRVDGGAKIATVLHRCQDCGQAMAYDHPLD